MKTAGRTVLLAILSSGLFVASAEASSIALFYNSAFVDTTLGPQGEAELLRVSFAVLGHSAR